MVEARRVATGGLLLGPAVLVLYFAFNSGGFHPGAPAYVAVALCVVLAARMMLAARPYPRFNLPLALAAGGLAVYALLSLASGLWSHAPGVARVEFDLPLLYLLVLLLCASIGQTRARLRWMLRALAAAVVIVCACGLVTRLLPHVWPTSPAIANNRLSFPVTYWNTLGLIAAVGIVLCLHFSSDLREPRASRIIGAAAIPLLAVTLFFTFSRGSIAVCLIAMLVYVLLGRERGLPSAAIAVIPVTAVAVKLAYDANLLATPDPTSPAAAIQGRHLALALMACIVGAGLLRTGLSFSLDPVLERLQLAAPIRRRATRAAWASLAAVAVVAALVLHGTIANDYQRFFSRSTPGSTTDLRARLTDPANGARIDVWTVAWRDFKSVPLLGRGAGTFVNTWARDSTDGQFVRDAHSLYLESLDELGIVGLAVLLTIVGTIFVRVFRRAHGSGRSLYAAVFAVLLAWAIHAGFDWDWEMPVVTVIFFALGGFILGRRLGRSGRPPRAGHSARPATARKRRSRVGRQVGIRAAGVVALGLVALLPGYLWVSQTKLDDAAYLFGQNDCAGARSAARSSISALGDRAEPYEIVSYCDVRLGLPDQALAAINKATSLDRQNWNYAYSLMLVRAAVGLDPRAAARTALALNRRDALVQAGWQTFHAGYRAQWRAEATAMVRSLTSL